MAVWPFIPQHGVRETLIFKSDVIRAYNAEQRIALTRAPRQMLEFEYLLDGRDFARAKAMVYGAGTAMWALPNWTEMLAIGDWPAAQQTQVIDTDNLDFRNGDYALLIQDNDTSQSLGVNITLGATTVDAGAPTAIGYYPAYIVPLRTAYMPSGARFDRTHPTHARARVEWAVVDGADLSAAHDFDTYRTYPVMTDRAVVLSDFAETIQRHFDAVDYGLAPPALDTIHAQAAQRSVAAWSCQTKAELWRLRCWLHTCKGRQKAFWMPTWAEDFTLRQDVLSADTVLHVESVEYATYYGLRHIMVLKRDGTRIYLRVTSGAAETGGDALTLSAAVGQNIAMADVDRVCLLNLMRFGSDRFEIRHRPGGADMSTLVEEVPAE